MANSADKEYIMKRFRFLIAVLAGTFVYVLISLAGGKNGLFAGQQLQEQKRILSAKTEQIQKIHDSLTLECNALEKDPDVIAAFARRLGFVKNGEKIVKINGLHVSDQFHFDTGIAIKAEEPYGLPEWFCKMLGLIAFGIAYFALILEDYRKGLLRRRQVTVKGIPVYDLPQV